MRNFPTMFKKIEKVVDKLSTFCIVSKLKSYTLLQIIGNFQNSITFWLHFSNLGTDMSLKERGAQENFYVMIFCYCG